MNERFIPSIMTNVNGLDQVTDSFNIDFVNRKIYLVGEIDSITSTTMISILRYLASKSNDDITLFINSPGGIIQDGLAIYDTINGINCDVVTVAYGRAASMGAFLLACGTHGKRYALQNTEILIHQPLGKVQGQATDIILAANNIKKTKDIVASILAERCKKTADILLKDMERDYVMSSEEALLYGLIDRIGFPDTF